MIFIILWYGALTLLLLFSVRVNDVIEWRVCSLMEEVINKAEKEGKACITTY